MLARIALLLVIIGVPAFAQRYTVIRESAQSASSEVVTIQQPATGAAQVGVEFVVVQCDAQCAVFIDRDGTAATTTATVPALINASTDGPAATKAFYSSNVGGGTKITPTLTLATNQIQTFDLRGVYMQGAGTAKNISVHVGPLTGNVRVQFIFQER